MRAVMRVTGMCALHSSDVSDLIFTGSSRGRKEGREEGIVRDKGEHVAYLHIEADVDDPSRAIVQVDGQLVQRELLEELAEVTLQQVPAGPLLDVRRPAEPGHLAHRTAAPVVRVTRSIPR